MKTLIHIGGRTCVEPSDVVAIFADINYSSTFMRNGRVIMVATTLKELEKRFDSMAFFRVHKSCLINLNYLNQYDFQSVEMDNHLKSPVARRKRGTFNQRLRAFGILS